MYITNLKTFSTLNVAGELTTDSLRGVCFWSDVTSGGLLDADTADENATIDFAVLLLIYYIKYKYINIKFKYIYILEMYT